MVRRTFTPRLVFLLLIIPTAAWVHADLKITRSQGVTHTYSIEDLNTIVGETHRTIGYDDLYKKTKHYLGYDLRSLLTSLELPLDADYLLICEDGYEIAFDARILLNGSFQGFLARKDLEAKDGPWLTTSPGNQNIVLAPFYLTWTSAPSRSDIGEDPVNNGSTNKEGLLALPWPYALVEIRADNPNRRYVQAAPLQAAEPLVQQGFNLYTQHCIKCHKIRGAGGSLGPELTSNPVVALSQPYELAEVIANIKQYYPNSKMPVYGNLLGVAERNALAAYLRHVNVPLQSQ